MSPRATGSPSPPTAGYSSFTFGTCPRRTKNLRRTVVTPQFPLVDGTGTLADPNGTVATPDGSSPGAGGFDAALVRAAP